MQQSAGAVMARHIKGDSIGRKSPLLLLELVSFPGIVHRSLVLFIAVLLLPESVAATPAQFSPLLDPPPVSSLKLRLKKGEAKSWGGSSSIAQQPAATEQDATRATAERAAQEGMQLYRQGTAKSLRQAIAKFEEALPLYRTVRDRRKEALILNNIGYIYSALGEKQKALNFFNQSLPLTRATGDKAAEAVTLSNIGGVYSAL